MTSGSGHDDNPEGLSVFAKAALFSHVDVTDLDDWRTVLFRLAERYDPALLPGMQSAAAKKARGRPIEQTDGLLWKLAAFVDIVKHKSAEGVISRVISSDRAACEFIAGRDPVARSVRHAIGLKPGLAAGTLRNMLSKARTLEKSWHHEKS